MESLSGLDLEENIPDETEIKDGKVTALTEVKRKRRPFHYWTVNGMDYKLKLNTAMITKLENKYRRNIMNLLMADEIPPLSVMLTVTQATIVPWSHGIKYERVQEMFDTWVNQEGGSQLKFYTEIIVPTLAVSGFFTEEQADSILKSMESGMDML